MSKLTVLNKGLYDGETKARRSEVSCFCVAKCEPFGEQKKTR